ncbi:phage holin family protein [Sphingomonas sp.]|jgi:predicted phage tail protein|uniref:phage holin family protein n=1 Tax=Sphingomonas sp. TaxID=28214 RepID=UPI002ED845E8
MALNELSVEHRQVQQTEPGVAALVTQLIDDTREVVSAEIAVHKARIGERAAAYKGAAVFFAIAGVLALAALIAMLVGAILSLATLIGPGLATLAIVLGTLLIAGVLAMIGKRRLAAPPVEMARA